MTSHTSPHLQHYFVPQPSPYPFILSGGGAYCMTLRLDRKSETQAAMRAAE